MVKWWWRFLPVKRRTAWKLEKRRIAAISSITGDKELIELMVQRPRAANESLDVELLNTVRTRLADIEARARVATLEDELEDLEEDGESQGLFAAYFCPVNQIRDEATITLDTIDGWGIPKSATNLLEKLFSGRLENAVADPHSAREALYSIHAEADAWDDFIEDYEEIMDKYTKRLWWCSVVMLGATIAALWWAPKLPILVAVAVLLAGATGSCISILAKRPARDATLRGELDAYAGRIFARIGAGVAASLIGCGLLGWGVIPISIEKQTFQDALDICTTSSSCQAVIKALLIIAVAMLLGFSERVLTSFENRILGELHSTGRKRQRSK